MDKPKYTINVTVDKPELIPGTPDVNGECTGFVLIRFYEDKTGDATISGASVEQIAKAFAGNTYLEQAMAIAEGYIKAMHIVARDERASSVFEMFMGGDK